MNGIVGRLDQRSQGPAPSGRSRTTRALHQTRATKDQIEALITRLTDIAATLHDADPKRMADAYDKLGLRLTYHPYAQPCILHAEGRPETGNKGKWSVSEGDLNTQTREISPDRGNHAATRRGLTPRIPSVATMTMLIPQ
jgi:hypothetical protein